MTNIVQNAEAVLERLVDPILGVDFKTAKMIRAVDLQADGMLNVTLRLGYPARVEGGKRAAEAEAALSAAGIKAVVKVEQEIIAHKVQGTLKVLPGVKNIIAVASGKGGVGKSTVAANLALALMHEGANVGILDADIYGPSQPTMLGVHEAPDSKDGKTMEPVESLGLQVNSIGFLVKEDDPMIWRGPMAAGALQQLLKLTNWRDLDYLVVDMPPGTGDIQLTLAQTVPVTGALMVTTPQDIALIDAKKGLRMFQKVGVPILGIVENMSVFVCPCCGKATPIFGEGGADNMSREYGVPVLGRLPIDPNVRQAADAGIPRVAQAPESASAQIFREMALRAAGAVALLGKDYSAKMPPVRPIERK